MIKNIVIIVMFGLVIPFKAWAFSVKASVDRTQLTEEDSLVLTVSVADGDAQVDTSVIKDFQIVSHSTGSSFNWINGQSSSEYNHIYTLVPLKKGRLFIPPLPVTLKGKTLFTEKIAIVSDNRHLKQNGVTEDTDIFVKASVNDESPYPGQSIVYTFALYYSAQLSSPSLKLPEFKNFTVKENDKDLTSSTVINGREYQVIERKVILGPLKPGTITIPPSVLNCQIAVASRNRSRDPFNSLFNDPFFNRASMIQKTLKTNALIIRVLPLPENPGPAPFSGLIGSFKLTAKLQSNPIKVGDSTTLSLFVEGKGNLMDATDPTLNVPSGLKMYKDSPIDEITMGRDGYNGRRTFRMAFVGVKPGSYTLSPIAFSYFDIESGHYRVLATEPFTITVDPSPNMTEGETALATGGPSNTGHDPEKKKVEFTGHDILPLKESLDGVKNRPAPSVSLFCLGLMIPLTVLCCIRFSIRYRGRGKSLSSLMAERAERALKDAAQKNIGNDDFLSLIYLAFVSTVFSKNNTSGESLTRREMRSILEAQACQNQDMESAERLLDRIESCRFSGVALDESTRRKLLEDIRTFARRIA